MKLLTTESGFFVLFLSNQVMIENKHFWLVSEFIFGSIRWKKRQTSVQLWPTHSKIT